MAVESVREINKGRDGGITREGDTEYVRTFLVKTNGPHDNAATIMASGALPSWLSVFSAGGVTDLSARVRDIRCKPRDEMSPYWWDVTVKYDSHIEPGERLDAPGSEITEDNPLTRPPSERWETYRTTEIRDRDLGTPVHAFKNSAGQLFTTGLEVEVVYPVLVIVRNEPVPPQPDIIRFVNAINDDPWKGKEIYRWKCLDITSAEGEEKIGGITVFYDQVRYEFALKDEEFGWQFRVLDQGPCERVQALVNNAPILDLQYKRDTTGAVIEKDQLLDGNGRFLPDNGQEVFLPFFRNPQLPFQRLGLGN